MQITFRHYSYKLYLLVLALMSVLLILMYGHAVNAAFQFDDEPNITKCPAIQIKTLSLATLSNAVRNSKAPNRILVSVSFALQHWMAQYLPRLIDSDSPRPDAIAWQFRTLNLLIHLCTGFAVFLLFLHLLQLPGIPAHLKEKACPLALIAALLWFCNPVQTQAVTYIVQRAASMATLFLVLALIAYLRARSATTDRGRIAGIAVMLLLMLFAAFSKETGTTLILIVPAMEYLLIRDSSRCNWRWIWATTIPMLLIIAVSVSWYYGRKRIDSKNTGEVNPTVAAEKLYDDLVGKMLTDRITNLKIRMSPRQRLITEARVVAMYQSLLVFPSPARLNLDYDFLESTGMLVPGEYEHFRQWIPLLMILFAAGVTALVPSGSRARALLLTILLFGLIELLSDALGRNPSFLISRTWQNPWPVPAFAWHLLLLGFAACYSFRRPLLSFCIVFFYIGHIIESTIISLEVVFEHRLYLSSVGFVLGLTVLLFEATRDPTGTADVQE